MQPANDADRPMLGWQHLGLIRHADAMALQEERWQALHDGAVSDVLWTLEHLPVITLGRRAQDEDVLLLPDELFARGIEVVRSDRGGEVTYHGPGQLVLYPNLQLSRFRLGPADVVRALAAVIVDEVRTWGVDAAYDPAHPGVWAAGSKLAAVGMRIRRGVSMHGAALNLTTDLRPFDWFVPCGMAGAAATSMEVLSESWRMERPTDDAVAWMAGRLAARFAARLGAELRAGAG
jgi:lipoyl(octanoyl) transferase